MLNSLSGLFRVVAELHAEAAAALCGASEDGGISEHLLKRYFGTDDVRANAGLHAEDDTAP